MKRTVQFKWGAYQSRVHILPYPRYYLSVNPSSYAPSISITATLSKQSEARDISRGGPSSKQKSRNSPASFTSVLLSGNGAKRNSSAQDLPSKVARYLRHQPSTKIQGATVQLEGFTMQFDHHGHVVARLRRGGTSGGRTS